MSLQQQQKRHAKQSIVNMPVPSAASMLREAIHKVLPHVQPKVAAATERGM
jgi:hypothetical protein